MNTNVIKIITAILTAGLMAVSLATPVQAEEEQESAMARGGKLYDKWYKVIDVDPPKQSHPAYPADKKYAAKPKANWRCKECHGWDYKGVNGAYASGKHSTGIKGIDGMFGADPAKIIAVLKDSTHGYADKLGHDDFHDLALFVSKGQVDMSKYIDYASKSPKGGDAHQGAAYYNTICAGCHTKDGNKPKDMDKTLAKQMGNPQEVMHKILNGQPAEKMPALRALDRQIILDIMAHLKTMPKEM
ncbi:MAG: c-type cytochrome [Gammaproteobacteria bacterium]